MKIFTPDADDDDRVGSGLLHFEGSLWWFLKPFAQYHDDCYEAIRRGSYLIWDGWHVRTFKIADKLYQEKCREYVMDRVDELTPAQKRWALMVTGWAWPAFRAWERLTT